MNLYTRAEIKAPPSDYNVEKVKKKPSSKKMYTYDFLFFS